MRVLVVEDSPRVAAYVGRTLKDVGAEVTAAPDFASGKRALEDSAFALAVIDVGLPDGSGLDLCRLARETGLDLPILLLTAQNEVRERVRGLDAGADDYLGKPFSGDELRARARALLRRGPRFTESLRTYGSLEIDRERRQVRRDGKAVPLTPRELEITALIAFREGRVFPREELLEVVWGEATERAAASLDVLIARIRRKLGPAREHGEHGERGERGEAVENGVIRTIRGTGYAWALGRSKAR